MKVTNSNVLIAGAGPVGLAMAADLARYGVSVHLVEKTPERTDKSKAFVLWSRTLELMDRMDCTAPFLTTGKKVTAVNVTAGSLPAEDPRKGNALRSTLIIRASGLEIRHGLLCMRMKAMAEGLR
jgi:2-polyprenyl-6-methoxyphenol hydroxylase-like FAD-dependent oxidoreductase